MEVICSAQKDEKIKHYTLTSNKNKNGINEEVELKFNELKLKLILKFI